MTATALPDVPVTVAIPTFRRPDLLHLCLEEVIRQCTELSIVVEVIVVDNDPDRSAEQVISALAVFHPVRYINEPTPGIAAVRDTAVNSAEDSRLLVFIDDDEVPSPGWLSNLLRYWQSSQVAAVAGPQELVLPDPIPDPWVVASGVFDSVRHPTGRRGKGASSANLLLDLHFLREHNISFDRGLGLRGGEDTMLTHRITAAGGLIEWCDEAIVVELVPPERVTRAWMRRRSFRSGASWGRAEIATARNRRERAVTRGTIVLRSCAHVIAGAGNIGYGLLRRDVERVARNARKVYSHTGALSSTLGAPQIEDYSRT